MTGPTSTTSGRVRLRRPPARLRVMLDAFAEHGPSDRRGTCVAVGHRVVHGGARFTEPDAGRRRRSSSHIERLVPLAPLHNPANLAGHRARPERVPRNCRTSPSSTPRSTSTLPAGTPTRTRCRELWRDEHGIRRYGFHGTSHEYVSRRAAQRCWVGPLEDTRPDRPAPGQRRLRVARVRRRPVHRHLDGAHPARGAGHGHPLRRRRPGPGLPPDAPGLSIADYDRAQPRERPPGAVRGQRLPRGLAKVDAGDADATLGVRRDRPPARQVRRRVCRRARSARRPRLHRRRRRAQPRPAGRRRRRGWACWVPRSTPTPTNRAGERRVSASDSAIDVWVVPTNEELEIARQTVRVIHG